MEKNRIEAFSDGVIAIIITIMVLNLKVPETADLSELRPQLPVFLTYALSYLYVGIYWNNHHHLLKAARRATSAVMWANLHLLFWLSLFPFMTGWMGENHFQTAPTAIYGVVLLMAGVAYFILQNIIVADHGRDSKMSQAIGGDLKGKLSMLLYATGIVVAFWHAWISAVIYMLVALMWLIPDKRLEQIIHERREGRNLATDETRIEHRFLMNSIWFAKTISDQPSPHPDPLPSHRTGAERGQQSDICSITKALIAVATSIVFYRLKPVPVRPYFVQARPRKAGLIRE